MHRLARLLTLMLLATVAHAQSEAEGPVANEGARSPGDLTVDERKQMIQSANDYNTCVYKHAMANIKADDDIRRIADMAMGYCQPGLDDLQAEIAGWGFEPHFAAGFTRSVRDRAAHQLLPELAVQLGN